MHCLGHGYTSSFGEVALDLARYVVVVIEIVDVELFGCDKFSAPV